MWPNLRKIAGDFQIYGPVQIRPVDLYETKGFRQDGVVLVGDAFATSCPSVGTGVLKALVDVERLCNVHIPKWLSMPGMDAVKLAAFYDDEAKIQCDSSSARKAFQYRSFYTDTGVRWTAMRWVKFLAQWARGMTRAKRSQPARPASARTASRFYQGFYQSTP
jgi:2-polyprenyl-6-methoxyphenol hydroxylase-like FAD-dependent oxidoreductase